MSDQNLTLPADCRPISFAPGYQVRDGGDVYSCLVSQYRKPTMSRKCGYFWVNLVIGGKLKAFFVHGLVLEVFGGPRPDGMQVCHNDGDKLNNFVSNLRWGTARDNALDRVKHGTAPVGERNPKAKLKKEDIPEIFRLYREGLGKDEIASRYGVTWQNVNAILKRWTWKSVDVDFVLA